MFFDEYGYLDGMRRETSNLKKFSPLFRAFGEYEGKPALAYFDYNSETGKFFFKGVFVCEDESLYRRFITLAMTDSSEKAKRLGFEVQKKCTFDDIKEMWALFGVLPATKVLEKKVKREEEKEDSLYSNIRVEEKDQCLYVSFETFGKAYGDGSEYEEHYEFSFDTCDELDDWIALYYKLEEGNLSSRFFKDFMKDFLSGRVLESMNILKLPTGYLYRKIYVDMYVSLD